MYDLTTVTSGLLLWNYKVKKKTSSNQQLDILLDLSIIPCKGKKQIFVVMESYRNVQSKNFQCAAD